MNNASEPSSSRAKGSKRPFTMMDGIDAAEPPAAEEEEEAGATGADEAAAAAALVGDNIV